jgi:hypothetical protein
VITDKDAAYVRVDFASGCWVWQGPVGSTGYGRVGSSARLAHRYFYEHTLGVKLRRGLVLDHTCSNKRCVNPAHLDEVSQKENVHRWVQRHFDVPPGHFGCGHPHENNTRVEAAGPRCHTCYKARYQRYNAKKSAQRRRLKV